MAVLGNVRLTPKGREAMVRAVVEDGLSKSQDAPVMPITCSFQRLLIASILAPFRRPVGRVPPAFFRAL